tara:strand:- start:116 stop:844 length:729 start_codon:yes stop_codon:yes gene_type:complete
MRVIKTAVKLQDMKSKTSALVSSSSTVNDILNWLKDKFTADDKAIKYSELTNEELMSVDSFNHNIQMLLANEYFGKPTNADILGYYALVERVTKQKGKDDLKTINFEKVSKKKFDESNSTAKIEVTIDKIVNLDISDADVPLNATIIKGFKDIRRKFVKDIVHKRLDSWRITARKLESGKGKGKGAGRQNKKLDKWLSDMCDTATKKVQLAFEKDTELNFESKAEINKGIAQIKLLSSKLYS